MTNSKLIKNTVIYAAGDIFPKLFWFITFPILTVYLTPSDYGIVNYINTLNLFLNVFSFLCLNTYYLVYYFRVEDSVEQAKLLGNLSIFIIGLNIIFSIIFSIIGYFVFGKTDSGVTFCPYILLGISINFFSAFCVLPSALYRVQERPFPLTLLNILKGLLTMGTTLVLVVLYDFKALGVLYSNLLITMLFAVIFSIVTVKNMIWTVNWGQIRSALKFSLPLLPGSLAYYVVTMSDRVLIESYLGTYALGIYSTAATLAMVLNIVSYGAYKAFEPYFFKVYGTWEFKEKFRVVHDNFLFLVLISVVCLSLFAKEFFELFSSKPYHVAYRYVPFILLGTLFSGLSMMYATIITARNKTVINSMITIFGGSISVLLNVLFLSYYGIIVACLTSTISLGLICLLSYHYAHVEIYFWRSLIAILVVCVCILFVVYELSFCSIVLAIGVKALVSYLMLIVISKILQINIFELVKRIVPVKLWGKNMK